MTTDRHSIRFGAEAFLAEFKDVGLTAAEQDLFILGHYNGAVTVLAILEDLLLSGAGGLEQVKAVQGMIEEAAKYVQGRRELLVAYKAQQTAIPEPPPPTAATHGG